MFREPRPRAELFRCIAASIAIVLAFVGSAAEAKVVKTADYPDYAAAIAALQPGDVLLCNSSNPGNLVLPPPPNNVQIIGGKAKWQIHRDVENVIFFRHEAEIEQTGGIFKKCLFYYSVAPHSIFTGLDSCLIVGAAGGKHLPVRTLKPAIEVDGFLRATSMSHFRSGGTGGGGIHSGIHSATISINAWHPVGDGRGTHISSFINHGQADWSNLRILNGRGITVANWNSEYAKSGDPMIIVENGAEVSIVQSSPGGYEPSGSWGPTTTAPDGRDYHLKRSYRGAVMEIAGQHNQVIGGTKYKSFWKGGPYPDLGLWKPDLNALDPWLSIWNAKELGFERQVNIAPAMRHFYYGWGNNMTGFGAMDGSSWQSQNGMGSAFTGKGNASFVSASGAVDLSGLKAKMLPPGPKLYPPFFLQLPKLKAGLGEDMSDKSVAEIEAALADRKTIYLGPGTYKLTKTVISGEIWGAGMDETILECPTGQRCVENGPSGIFNLTFKGGKVGYAQTKAFSLVELANVRFEGQTLTGATVGNAQNVLFYGLEFVNTKRGITTCQDGIPCGEDMTPEGGSMYDKVTILGCTFRDMEAGVYVAVNVNGYSSVYGSRFENLSDRGISILQGGSAKYRGYHVSGCTFKNCNLAVLLKEEGLVDNCVVEGKSGQTGIIGNLQAVINCEITGLGSGDQGVQVQDYGVVYNVKSSGALETASNSWVGKSSFPGGVSESKVYLNGTDITQYVDLEPKAFDKTAPSAPANVKTEMTAVGVRITWDASEDSQSGVLHYIIARDHPKLEIGRTPMRWKHAAPREVEPFSTTTEFLDSLGKQTSKYFVTAVNGAYIRSDDKMDRLNLLDPWFTGDDTHVKVFPGKVTTHFRVDYSGTRAYPKEFPSAGTPVSLERQVSRTVMPSKLANSIHVYDLKGRRVAVIPTDAYRGLAAWGQAAQWRDGLYFLRSGNRTWTEKNF